MLFFGYFVLSLLYFWFQMVEFSGLYFLSLLFLNLKSPFLSIIVSRGTNEKLFCLPADTVFISFFNVGFIVSTDVYSDIPVREFIFFV